MTLFVRFMKSELDLILPPTYTSVVHSNVCVWAMKKKMINFENRERERKRWRKIDQSLSREKIDVAERNSSKLEVLT